MSLFTGIVESMREFDQTGEAFVCVTLAGAKGSIPQEIGAKMLVTEAGRSCGTIGGGRVEEAAIKRARELLASEGESSC